MKQFPIYVLSCLLLFCGQAQSSPEVQKIIDNQPYPVPVIPATDAQIPVKNVIYMIGDGMGIHQLAAASVANRGQLFIYQCPVTGLSRTTCTDRLVTDSAAAGTALATGHKTLYSRVGMDPKGNHLPSLIDEAAEMGKSAGIIVSCGLNDATPASFYAHREKRSDADGIIGQLPTTKADIIVGGGCKAFTQRQDGRNIPEEMKAQGFQVTTDPNEFDPSQAAKSLLLVGEGEMPTPPERGDLIGVATKKTLEALSKNPKGFVLMIEGSNIDKRAHQNKFEGMMAELKDFDQTVGIVLDWASKHPGTLVVITADHNTGGFMITGGNQATGEVSGSYSTMGHDGVTVPVYAYGAGSPLFTGVYENTAIHDKISALMHGKATSAPTE